MGDQKVSHSQQDTQRLICLLHPHCFCVGLVKLMVNGDSQDVEAEGLGHDNVIEYKWYMFRPSLIGDSYCLAPMNHEYHLPLIGP